MNCEWKISCTTFLYDIYRDQPNYKKYGSALEIVTDRSQEGAQFVKGFGGIGGNIY